MATDWAALRKFYVYDLIDPRDLRTFYVGKGQGDRVSQHLRGSFAGAMRYPDGCLSCH